MPQSKSTRTSLQLQKKFKHSGDFGVTGNYSTSNAAKFSAAMHQHINAARTQRIVGTYRNSPAAHYVDPKTGLNVVSDLDGNFITGFRLGTGQLDDVLTTGRLW
ncbi:colicin D domain-containing protein [Agromyces sp. NBRC 114283]|uniref:colicin D domain-containing protein n=1 Tax=Agromyces sp. NBRC 114283 TaxID=2994521 RepID=UPI00255362DC|nr:colicin D domain-containing protein [Agromyces sp. NBRC 114283]